MQVTNISALLLAVLMTVPLQQQDVILQLGSFTWEGTAGSVNLQLHPAHRQITVAVGLTNIVRVDGRNSETVAFPSGEVTAWLLRDDGSAMRHVSTYPPAGRQAPGAGNGGGGASWAFVTFESPVPGDSTATSRAIQVMPSVVVVRIRKALYVFSVPPRT